MMAAEPQRRGDADQTVCRDGVSTMTCQLQITAVVAAIPGVVEPIHDGAYAAGRVDDDVSRDTNTSASW